MAADVSSLARYLNGNRTSANGSPAPENQSVPVTRDLLGGGPSKVESEELDLDLHVPTGWEKRLDLKVLFHLLSPSSHPDSVRFSYRQFQFHDLYTVEMILKVKLYEPITTLGAKFSTN